MQQVEIHPELSIVFQVLLVLMLFVKCLVFVVVTYHRRGSHNAPVDELSQCSAWRALVLAHSEQTSLVTFGQDQNYLTSQTPEVVLVGRHCDRLEVLIVAVYFEDQV